MGAELAEVLKLTVAFLSGSVAAFVIQSVWNYLGRPQLRIVTRANTGLCVETPGAWRLPDGSYFSDEFAYARALVQNTGKQTARQCIAYIEKIIWVDSAKEEHVFSGRDLIEMKWSWRDHGPVDIPRNAHQYVDLFQIWKPGLERKGPRGQISIRQISKLFGLLGRNGWPALSLRQGLL